MIRLGKGFGEARLEAACKRALHFGTFSYKSVHSILKSNLDVQAFETELSIPSLAHENLRGAPYYV